MSIAYEETDFNFRTWIQPLLLYVCAKLPQSCPTLCDPMDYRLPGSSVQGFSRQEYWSGLPYPSPRDLPKSEIEPASHKSPALIDGFFTTRTT